MLILPETLNLPNLRHISMYFPRVDDYYTNFSNIFRRYAQTTGITFSEHCPKDWEVCAVDVGGQPWKMLTEELEHISTLPREERAVRGVAGYSVGKEMKRGYSPDSAKEHFWTGRRRRGYGRQDEFHGDGHAIG
jgi:hypothetical protein